MGDHSHYFTFRREKLAITRGSSFLGPGHHATISVIGLVEEGYHATLSTSLLLAKHPNCFLFDFAGIARERAIT